jgi:hypothetical protein
MVCLDCIAKEQKKSAALFHHQIFKSTHLQIWCARRLRNSSEFKLHFIQLAVEAIVGHKFSMRAAFGDDPFVDQNNFICIADGGQTVRNYK